MKELEIAPTQNGVVFEKALSRHEAALARLRELALPTPETRNA